MKGLTIPNRCECNSEGDACRRWDNPYSFDTCKESRNQDHIRI